jgi:hypothetical protein
MVCTSATPFVNEVYVVFFKAVGRESCTIVNKLGTDTDEVLEELARARAAIATLLLDFFSEQDRLKSKDNISEIIFILILHLILIGYYMKVSSKAIGCLTLFNIYFW